MNSLTSRIISAVIAALALLLMGIFYKETGVLIMSVMAICIAIYEMGKLMFVSHYPKMAKTNFFVLTVISFLFLFHIENVGYAHFVNMFVFLWVVMLCIFTHKKFENIEMILQYVAKFFLGYIYVCFLPLMILWTVQLQKGLFWFLTLLMVVFSGDVGAYIFGSLFGKTKIAPTLSPKKSLEGSLGGLLFSLLAALAMRFFFFENLPWWMFVVCGIGGGVLGQIGDFFESLIKRIAGVKDSGQIMPGHGGILDRIDGVLFAGPLFYVAALYAAQLLT